MKIDKQADKTHLGNIHSHSQYVKRRKQKYNEKKKIKRMNKKNNRKTLIRIQKNTHTHNNYTIINVCIFGIKLQKKKKKL